MARRPKITLSRKSSKLLEENSIGLETTNWNDVEDTEYAVYSTLRHYGYFYDGKVAAKWANTWVKANRSTADYKDFCAAEYWSISRTLSSLCKMHTNGAKFDKKRMAWIKVHVNEVIERGKDNIKNRTSSVVPIRRSPSEIIKERTNDFIAEIEDFIDQFSTESLTRAEIKEWSAYDLMKHQEVPYITAKAVHDYYQPLLAELEEVVKGTDRDLVEAYATLSTRARNAYLKLIKSIISDSDMYMNGKKAVRKPRAKKVYSAGVQTAHVKYCKSSKEFKLTSVNPLKLIGATEVYLFNTKYRNITYLVSDQKTGFSVKGTTIQGIDMEASYKKTLRKPELYFNDTLKATKLRMKKTLTALKTKSGTVNGRMGTDTILYKVY
ncbi:MAG: hypothetical protein COA84_12980 [Robiginitomaculum sp.]|nr:MAG: hypothetical protein COA84_12980 [Robiginitomaculum sp.]